ncbi:MAG TPA: D-glycerate dehydrogenase [Acidimicrobiales bacterium]|nr:D-glycerate dehydrogenase [Acidimicrobiales bacterium]
MTPKRVLVTRRLPVGSLDPLHEAGFDVVQRGEPMVLTPDEMMTEVRQADGVVCLLTDRIDRRVLEAGLGRLRVVANVAVGYDNIDVEAAKDLGVVVCNTPGVLDDTTADLTFLLILAASRLASDAERDLRAGRWTGWAVDQYLGQDVHGRTLGVIGWGRIGRRVADRARGFGMRVLHHARRPSGEPGYIADLDELIREADVVSIHVPLSDDTYHLIGPARIGLMKPTAVLVNTARGPIVDEEALADALHSNRIFAAGLDVYESEPAVHPRLLSAPRTVLLPHVGSASVATRTAMGRLASRSVVDVLSGRLPSTLVTI